MKKSVLIALFFSGILILNSCTESQPTVPKEVGHNFQAKYGKAININQLESNSRKAMGSKL